MRRDAGGHRADSRGDHPGSGKDVLLLTDGGFSGGTTGPLHRPYSAGIGGRAVGSVSRRDSRAVCRARHGDPGCWISMSDQAAGPPPPRSEGARSRPTGRAVLREVPPKLRRSAARARLRDDPLGAQCHIGTSKDVTKASKLGSVEVTVGGSMSEVVVTGATGDLGCRSWYRPCGAAGHSVQADVGASRAVWSPT